MRKMKSAKGAKAAVTKALPVKVVVKKTKTLPFDVAEYLRTPAEQSAYLNAWLADAPDDIAGISRALGDVARARGMSKVARDAGLSRESLYKALSEKGNPSFATVLAVARAIDFSLDFSPMHTRPRKRQPTPA